jgi:hypothetical protein
MVGQLLTRPVQQCSAHATILESRKQRKDLYLSRFTHAEAEADDSPIDETNVTR